MTHSNTTVDSALIGVPLEDLDTPALLLDLAASDHNLKRMASFFQSRSCQLRPHFKNHKCVTLARRQLAAGAAVGMTCAKVGEAEVLADGGVSDVLIANQVVGRRKIIRLMELARRIHLRVAVDDAVQAEMLSTAATSAGVTLGILVEVDIGTNRCGVKPGQPALQLAQKVASLEGVRFDGLQAYEGHAVYVDDLDERHQLVRAAFELALETKHLIEQHGIEVKVISGGSSATHHITGCIDGVNEIQAGSYATMDWRYAQMLPNFQVALSVLARVISKRPGTAVLDVGLKGAGCEFGLPRIKNYPDAEIPSFVSEEHGIVRNAPDWNIGDVVELLPSHACTTCNLHRRIIVHQDGHVIDVWPIEGSGKIA